MDIGIIIAILGTGLIIVASIFTMMFWVRSESNQIRKDQKEDRKDLVQIVRSLENFTKDNLIAIREEIKDFHTRLLEIERGRSK